MGDQQERVYYEVNAPYVVHETIEGETIVMNLRNGYYYSFDGIGSAVWQLIVLNTDYSQLLNLMTGVFDNTMFNLQETVTAFIEELRSNDLIVEKRVEKNVSSSISKEEFNRMGIVSEIAVRPPQFHRYTDMRDVLLLDPIHDVDEKGWPEPKVRQYKNGVPNL